MYDERGNNSPSENRMQGRTLHGARIPNQQCTRSGASADAPYAARLGIGEPNGYVPETNPSNSIARAGTGQAAVWEMIAMCQTLRDPVPGSAGLQSLCCTDEMVFDLLEGGQLPLDQIILRVDACEQETVSSISKLIALGLVSLVLRQYPWGVEFDLRANPRAPAPQ